MDTREETALVRQKLLSIGSLLLLHAALSFTWIPQLFGIWPLSAETPSIQLTGLAAFLNLLGLLLFFSLSGYLMQVQLRNRPRYLWQKAIQNTKRFLHYYLLLSVLFSLLLIADKGRLLHGQEWSFLKSFYHLWFLIALAAFQLLLALLNWLSEHLQLHWKVGLGFAISVHVVGLFCQGGLFLKTPTQLNPDSLCSLAVYFSWFLYGFSQKKHFQNLGYSLWPSLVVIGLYFLTKTAILFSWRPVLTWKIGASLLDPFAFLIAMNCFDYLQRRYLSPEIEAQKLKTLSARIANYQLGVYVFQIPIIFCVLTVFSKVGMLLHTDPTALSSSPNWTESWQTWAWFEALLFVLLGLLWLLVRQKKQNP